MEPIDLDAFRAGKFELIGEARPLAFRYQGECQHIRHVVDAKLRRVTCKDCGERLDPIEVILDYIKYWISTREQIIHLERLRKEERERFRDKEDRRMARMIARHGGVWACSVDGKRSEYFDGGT